MIAYAKIVFFCRSEKSKESSTIYRVLFAFANKNDFMNLKSYQLPVDLIIKVRNVIVAKSRRINTNCLHNYNRGFLYYANNERFLPAKTFPKGQLVERMTVWIERDNTMGKQFHVVICWLIRYFPHVTLGIERYWPIISLRTHCDKLKCKFIVKVELQKYIRGETLIFIVSVKKMNH